MAVSAPGRGYILTIASAITSGTSDVAAPSPATRYHTIVVTSSSGVSSGTVQVESSDDPTYTGTWLAEGAALSINAATTKFTVTITGKRVAVRARITGAIMGGTINVTYEGN